MSKLTSLLIAASMLAGACTTSSSRAPREPLAVDEIVRPATVDRAKVRGALAARRTQTYARFLAYREARVYPVGDAAGFQHIWLDAFGHLCAAATMIEADWGFVATRAAVVDNHIALADVDDGALLDWVLTSGLTHHEIVAIQRPGFRADIEPVPPDIEQPVVDPRIAEIQRLYDGYVDVERQLMSMWDSSLDEAADALMKRPDLARALIRTGVAAGPGEFAAEADRVSVGFARPPT